MSGAARDSASPVTSAITKELPTEALTGRCAVVTTSSRREADTAGHQLDRHFRPERQRLRRGDGDAGCPVARPGPRPGRRSPRSAARRRGRGPARASTQPVPTLGWPAKGISDVRLKMRTRAVFAGSAGGSTKVVSLRLNSAASDCMSASLRPRASGKTASGLPPKRRSVKTSTVTKEKVAHPRLLDDLDADLVRDSPQDSHRPRRGIATVLRAMGLDAGHDLGRLNALEQTACSSIGPRHVVRRPAARCAGPRDRGP